MILASHHITKVYLRHVHEMRMHQGVEGCLAFVWRRFLVLAVWKLLRNIKQSCVTCRRHDASPASEVTAPLPKDRVQHQRAFAVVGVDHAGPLIVKDRGQPSKAWILLFVCATTRAVHLELVPSLSACDVLLSYRRL